MDQLNREDAQAQGSGDESLNTSDANKSQSSGSEGKHKKGGIHNNALYAASMGRAATAHVNPHNTSNLAQTGTNISYEGPTAPGAGGSLGTGFTSGQAATGAALSTESEHEPIPVGKRNDNERREDDLADEAENEINEQR
jgi:hypothetical protein